METANLTSWDRPIVLGAAVASPNIYTPSAMLLPERALSFMLKNHLVKQMSKAGVGSDFNRGLPPFNRLPRHQGAAIGDEGDDSAE
jgi:hypothetical protein